MPGLRRPGSAGTAARSARSAAARGRFRPLSRSPVRSTPRLALPGRPVPRGSGGSPMRVLPGQPEGQGPDVRAVAGRPVLPRMDRAARRRRTMSRCQRMIVSGVTSNRSPWRRAFCIAPNRVASRARSAQFRFGRRARWRCRMASWWRRIRISAVFHASSRRDSRSHVAIRVIRRKTNRRHMIGDHYDPTAARATLLVRTVDGIRDTHRISRAAPCSRPSERSRLRVLLQTPVAGACAGYRGCTARVRSFFMRRPADTSRGWPGDVRDAMCRIRPDLAGQTIAAL